MFLICKTEEESKITGTTPRGVDHQRNRVVIEFDRLLFARPQNYFESGRESGFFMEVRLSRISGGAGGS
jgi:hypothetical protein